MRSLKNSENNNQRSFQVSWLLSGFAVVLTCSVLALFIEKGEEIRLIPDEEISEIKREHSGEEQKDHNKHRRNRGGKVPGEFPF